MNRIASISIAFVGGLSLAVSGFWFQTGPAVLRAQTVGSRPSTPEHLSYVKIGELGADVPSGRTPAESRAFPIQIKSGEYSLEYARRTLVPAMGGSICLGDFDRDGRPDVYVAIPGGLNRLYRNNGNGTFTDVTSKAKVSGTGGSLSATFADYDHSGYPSLFVVGLGGVKLYRNKRDGTFADETQRAGLAGKPTELYTRAVVSDLDNDGYPDLLLTAYTDLSAPPAKPVFAFPNDFSGTSSRLYHGNPDGTFTDITVSAGLQENFGRTRSAVSADFNGDGRPDLLLLRDEKPPILYLNRGDGTFRDATYDADEQLSRNAFFDAQAVDFNGDGKMDLALWSAMASRVVINQGNASFEREESLPALVTPPTPFGFHGTVGDLNNDGLMDLLVFDNKGNWRVFLNQAGHFHEALFQFHSEIRQRSVAETIDSAAANPFYEAVAFMRLKNQGPYLLALESTGGLAVFRMQTAGR